MEKDFIKKTPISIIANATEYSENMVRKVNASERKNTDISNAIIIMNKALAKAETTIIKSLSK